MIRTLLIFGADTELIDANGHSVLHIAATSVSSKSVSSYFICIRSYCCTLIKAAVAETSFNKYYATIVKIDAKFDSAIHDFCIALEKFHFNKLSAT